MNKIKRMIRRAQNNPLSKWNTFLNFINKNNRKLKRFNENLAIKYKEFSKVQKENINKNWTKVRKQISKRKSELAKLIAIKKDERIKLAEIKAKERLEREKIQAAIREENAKAQAIARTEKEKADEQARLEKEKADAIIKAEKQKNDALIKAQKDKAEAEAKLEKQKRDEERRIQNEKRLQNEKTQKEQQAKETEKLRKIKEEKAEELRRIKEKEAEEKRIKQAEIDGEKEKQKQSEQKENKEQKIIKQQQLEQQLEQKRQNQQAQLERKQKLKLETQIRRKEYIERKMKNMSEKTKTIKEGFTNIVESIKRKLRSRRVLTLDTSMPKEITVEYSPKSYVSESFRTLRTNIQFMNSNKNIKSILVTSTMQAEGKSYVSSNLAATFAQANKKVIIVDADMRKGRIHEVFKIAKQPGLSNYLSGITVNGTSDEFKDYIKQTSIENLYVLPMGNTPPNPSELIASEKMISLIKNLKEIFDVVIFDGTPSKIVTDSVILSREVDTTLIVTGHNKTKMDDLKKVQKDIENVGGKIAGVVINNVPINTKKYASSYYYENLEGARKKVKKMYSL